MAKTSTWTALQNLSKHVACKLNFWHMCCGARHCCDMGHEQGERFAFVSLSDVDGSLAAILLFHVTRWRSRRYGGPQANDVCHDHLVSACGGRVSPQRLAQCDQSVRPFGGYFLNWGWFCFLFSGLDSGPARNCL